MSFFVSCLKQEETLKDVICTAYDASTTNFSFTGPLGVFHKGNVHPQSLSRQALHPFVIFFCILDCSDWSLHYSSFFQEWRWGISAATVSSPLPPPPPPPPAFTSLAACNIERKKQVGLKTSNSTNNREAFWTIDSSSKEHKRRRWEWRHNEQEIRIPFFIILLSQASLSCSFT